MSEKMEVEFTSRYGGRYPSFLRGCRSKCEAMGWVPIKFGEEREPWASLWVAAEIVAPSDDGWHFVKCPSCEGTGRIPWWRSVLRIPLWLWRSARQTYLFTTNPDYFCGDQKFIKRLTTSLRICFWMDIIRLRN